MIKLLSRNRKTSSTLNIEGTRNNRFVSVDDMLVSHAKSKIEEGYRSQLEGQAQVLGNEPNKAINSGS